MGPIIGTRFGKMKFGFLLPPAYVYADMFALSDRPLADDLPSLRPLRGFQNDSQKAPNKYLERNVYPP